jgi:hypothetical protein
VLEVVFNVSKRLKLPENLSCSHCVLQWKYRAGNSWGADSGSTGVGLGAQEEFYNCADIQILDSRTESGSESELNLAPSSEIYPQNTTQSIDVSVNTTSEDVTTSSIIIETDEISLTREIIQSTKHMVVEIKSTETTSTTSEIKESISNKAFRCKRLPVELAALASRKTDPNEFLGTPVCYLIGRSKLTCKDCYENCITPLRKCPRKDCYCKWYPDLR